jgi:hypothetical protein
MRFTLRMYSESLTSKRHMTECNKSEISEVLSNVVNAFNALIHVHKHITVQKTEAPNIKIAISTTNKIRQEKMEPVSCLMTQRLKQTKL